jgi:hypothetical protein
MATVPRRPLPPRLPRLFWRRWSRRGPHQVGQTAAHPLPARPPRPTTLSATLSFSSPVSAGAPHASWRPARSAARNSSRPPQTDPSGPSPRPSTSPPATSSSEDEHQHRAWASWRAPRTLQVVQTEVRAQCLGGNVKHDRCSGVSRTVTGQAKRRPLHCIQTSSETFSPIEFDQHRDFYFYRGVYPAWLARTWRVFAGLGGALPAVLLTYSASKMTTRTYLSIIYGDGAVGNTGARNCGLRRARGKSFSPSVASPLALQST